MLLSTKPESSPISLSPLPVDPKPSPKLYPTAPVKPSDDGLGHLVPGYPRLAGYMAQTPETAIFRRFNELHAKMLLYMQADLYRLERELLEVERSDSRGKGDKPKYALNYECLASSKDGDTKQIELVEEIKEKLREYSNALIQASTLFQLKNPDDFDLTDLQEWFHYEEPERRYLHGPPGLTWGTQASSRHASADLLAIKPRVKEDSFSRWIAEKGVHLLNPSFTRFLKCRCCLSAIRHSKSDCAESQPQSQTRHTYYDSTVLRWTFWTTSVFAGLLPVVSIAVLLALQGHVERVRWIQVGVIAGFNVVISVCLVVLAEAKRTDCFAVTAAFTAIQVVFLGVDGNKDKPANL